MSDKKLVFENRFVIESKNELTEVKNYGITE